MSVLRGWKCCPLSLPSAVHALAPHCRMFSAVNILSYSLHRFASTCSNLYIYIYIYIYIMHLSLWQQVQTGCHSLNVSHTVAKILLYQACNVMEYQSLYFTSFHTSGVIDTSFHTSGVVDTSCHTSGVVARHLMSHKWSGRHLMSHKWSGRHLMSHKWSGRHIMSHKWSGS